MLKQINRFMPLSFFALATVAFANRPSNTVPSSELDVSFMVGKMARQDQAFCMANVARVTGEGDQRDYETLTLAGGDTVRCSFGAQTVTLDENGGTETGFPYSTTGVYSFEFTRHNGEVFRAETVMPEQVKISTPEDNRVYRVGEEMYYEWNSVAAKLGLTFFGTSNCEDPAPGLEIEYTANSAKVPAGYTNGCHPDTQGAFGVLKAVMGARPAGVQGTALGVTADSRSFQFQPSATAQEPFRLEEFNLPRVVRKRGLASHTLHLVR